MFVPFTTPRDVMLDYQKKLTLDSYPPSLKINDDCSSIFQECVDTVERLGSQKKFTSQYVLHRQ